MRVSRAVRLQRLLAAAVVAAMVGWQAAAAAADDRQDAPEEEVRLSIVNGIGPIEMAEAAALMDAQIADPFEAQFCGAAIVSATAVLTAAHCVDDRRPDDVDVFIGAADLYSSAGIRVPAVRIDVHPRWQVQSDYDIAIVHLQREIAINPLPMIPPIWLASRNVPPLPGDMTNAFTAGWGCSSFDGDTNRCLGYPSELLGARVELLPAELCDHFAELVLERQGAYGLLCAGDVSEWGDTPDACQGDSGGPLTYPGARGFPVLVGITSWGVDCGYLPGVYTHVAAHHGWIIRQLSTSPAAQRPAAFPDVPPSQTHADGINRVASAQIAGGFLDGTFGPERTLTRGQMATFLARSLHLPRNQWFEANYGADDNQRGDAHDEAIAGVITAAIASGYPDGTFRPNEPVTRGQMATFLSRAFELGQASGELPPDVPSTSAHAPGIGVVIATGVATGFPDGTFRPNEPVTRGQMATFLARSLDLERATPPADDVEPDPSPTPVDDPDPSQDLGSYSSVAAYEIDVSETIDAILGTNGDGLLDSMFDVYDLWNSYQITDAEFQELMILWVEALDTHIDHFATRTPPATHAESFNHFTNGMDDFRVGGVLLGQCACDAAWDAFEAGLAEWEDMVDTWPGSFTVASTPDDAASELRDHITQLRELHERELAS